MAEALAAVGIAANIIQLIDFTAQLTARIIEFDSFVGEVPKSFRHINAELPILKYTVVQLQKSFRSDAIDPSTEKALVPALLECNTVLESLDRLLEKTLPKDTDSRGRKGAKAIISLIKNSEVENLIKWLRQLTRSLVYASLPLKSFENLDLVKLQKWVRKFDTVDTSRIRWANEKTHAPGTGTWFFQSKQFESWLRNARSLLWLHGMPGRGKSVLSSNILQHICNLQLNEPGTAVAYFFVSFKVEASRDLDNLILSLITQLAPQSINLPEGFERLYASCGNGSFRPSPPVALRLLSLVLAGLPEVFIVLDALDECVSHNHVIETMKEVIDWRFDNVHMIFTSRREQTFSEYFDRILQVNEVVDLENAIVDCDIEIYVQDRLMDSRWKGDEGACNNIRKALGRSNGMFRWAALQMDGIEKCINKSSLQTTLDMLPEDLDETYERILLAIPEVNRAYAIRLLTWVTYSREPQRLEILAEAAAINPLDYSPISEANRLRSPLDILTLCQGLIAPVASQTYGHPISQCKQEYTLSHFSVQEYLKSNRIRDSPACDFWLDKKQSDIFLAVACVTYLYQWQKTYCLDCWNEELTNSHLAKYCKKTWLVHARAAEPISGQTLNLISVYLGTNFALWDGRHPAPKTKEPQQHGGPPTAKLRYRRLLKRACMTGLQSLVRHVLETEFSCCPVKKRTRDRITAASLSYCLHFSTLMAVEIAAFTYYSCHILATLDSSKFLILSSLVVAQLWVLWHMAVESYLPKMKESVAPLSIAARFGSVPIVKVLLDAGEDQRWPLFDPEVSLLKAIKGKRADMVQYLLDNCFYSNVAKSLGKAIVGTSDCRIASILLHSTVGRRTALKYKEKDWSNYSTGGVFTTKLEVGVAPTLLHLIAARGFTYSFDPEQTKLALSELLAYTTTTSIHEQNKDGDTPLHLFVKRCSGVSRYGPDAVNEAIVLYLFHRGASPNVQNFNGVTPLHLIGDIWKQHIRDDLLRLFAMHDTNPDEPDKQGRTLLHVIACNDDGITRAIKCFPHATIDQRDHEGNAPLHFAASRGNVKGGLALLRLGADATVRNHAGATPLHMICRLGSIWHYEKGWHLKFELELPWCRDAAGLIVMDVKAQHMHRLLVQKLCQAGAEINALDDTGNSAFHWACMYWRSHGEIDCLLDLGADVNCLNSQGRTPLDFIADDSPELILEFRRSGHDCHKKYPPTRKWLREHGGRTAEELQASSV